MSAALLLPFGGMSAPVHFAGDLVLFAYLLALGRFFTAAAALDTGSAFEGMGAAREVTFACLAEPAMFLGLLALVKLSGSLELSGMLAPGIGTAWGRAAPTMVMIVAGLFVIVLAENSRIPVDDPNTHLELTMIHEVMVLDHSGPALAAVLYGASIKLFAMGAILVQLVVPVALGSVLLDWSVFLAAMIAFAVVVGVVESMHGAAPAALRLESPRGRWRHHRLRTASPPGGVEHGGSRRGSPGIWSCFRTSSSSGRAACARSSTWWPHRASC